MPSTSQPFDHLFSPLQVGSMLLRNRIINSPHQTGFARDGKYTDQLIAYHRERARGGSALIMSQATSVTADYLDLWNSSDEIIPQYRAVSAAVSEFGAHYGAELWHPGRQSEYTGSGAEVYVAPSAVPTNYFGLEWRVPHALEEAEIAKIISMFGHAAARCRAGGLSDVELHFAHGNLIEQFISPVTNLRTDDWGGPLENRLRIAREILEVVRREIGTDLALGCRLTGGGLDPGDLTGLDMAEVAGTMASWGLLDYISVTMGHYSDALNTARNIPNMTFRPGLWGRYGRQVKSVVEIPVFLVGRVNHPAVAEELIASGSCDAVVMARALIADPELPKKAQTGRVSEIRPCVGAMNCLNHLNRGGSIRCIHNATVSREAVWRQDLPPTELPREIVIVGAGPAGLECARVAAARGHNVKILERSAKVGGQVGLAASAPTRGELGQIIEWLEQECIRLKVDLQTGTTVNRELLEGMNPDAVIVATGSSMPANPFATGPLPTLDVSDALSQESRYARVVVYDEFGDWQGINVAHALAGKGSEVVFATPSVFPGNALETTNWRIAYERLSALGVRFYPVCELVGTEERAVVVRSGYGKTNQRFEDVDALVWVGMPVANDTLYQELAGFGAQVTLIGDAYAPRGIEASVYDGHKLGRAL